MTTLAERAQCYDREHARGLRALAYRMLGSRTEAEDIVQEAWLDWAQVDESTVQHAGAYLSRLVINLCLDKTGAHLRALFPAESRQAAERAAHAGSQSRRRLRKGRHRRPDANERACPPGDVTTTRARSS